MNTQTHVLLACAILVAPAVGVLRSEFEDSAVKTQSVNPVKRIGVAVFALAAIVGAILPDASIFVMFGVAKFQGVAESVIWREWYYSDFWQQAGAVSNSLPLYLAIACGAWLAGGRVYFHQRSHISTSQPPAVAASTRSSVFLIGSLAAILHAVTDFPLHHDDGHPHFWPLSNWIYASPVSYWDPAHYGNIWSVLEAILAFFLIVILWRRFKNKLVRGMLILVAVSYVLVLSYWVLFAGLSG